MGIVSLPFPGLFCRYTYRDLRGAYIIGTMESINVDARGEHGMMITSLVHTDNEVGRSR